MEINEIRIEYNGKEIAKAASYVSKETREGYEITLYGVYSFRSVPFRNLDLIIETPCKTIKYLNCKLENAKKENSRIFTSNSTIFTNEIILIFSTERFERS